jgi:alcohol dehydrogenase (NADP+)
VVGEALQQVIADGVVKREELFIVSKLMPSDCHVERVMPALRKTLADLSLDYVDCYLMHWPYFFVQKPSAFPVPENERLGYT